MIKHLTLPKKMAAMVLLAGAALSIAPVQAASYPTKQIELVVPYAAGCRQKPFTRQHRGYQ